MTQFAQALKALPSLHTLHFEHCFQDLKIYNTAEQLFSKLKQRKKPIRNLKFNGMYFGENNLFAACAFANKGYIGEKLLIDASYVAGTAPR